MYCGLLQLLRVIIATAIAVLALSLRCGNVRKGWRYFDVRDTIVNSRDSYRVQDSVHKTQLGQSTTDSFDVREAKEGLDLFYDFLISQAKLAVDIIRPAKCQLYLTSHYDRYTNEVVKRTLTSVGNNMASASDETLSLIYEYVDNLNQNDDEHMNERGSSHSKTPMDSGMTFCDSDFPIDGFDTSRDQSAEEDGTLNGEYYTAEGVAVSGRELTAPLFHAGRMYGMMRMLLHVPPSGRSRDSSSKGNNSRDSSRGGDVPQTEHYDKRMSVVISNTSSGCVPGRSEIYYDHVDALRLLTPLAQGLSFALALEEQRRTELETDEEYFLERQKANVNVYRSAHGSVQAVRTMAKLLEKRLPPNDEIGHELVHNILVQAESIDADVASLVSDDDAEDVTYNAHNDHGNSGEFTHVSDDNTDDGSTAVAPLNVTSIQYTDSHAPEDNEMQVLGSVEAVNGYPRSGARIRYTRLQRVSDPSEVLHLEIEDVSTAGVESPVNFDGTGRVALNKTILAEETKAPSGERKCGAAAESSSDSSHSSYPSKVTATSPTAATGTLLPTTHAFDHDGIKFKLDDCSCSGSSSMTSEMSRRSSQVLSAYDSDFDQEQRNWHASNEGPESHTPNSLLPPAAVALQQERERTLPNDPEAPESQGRVENIAGQNSICSSSFPLARSRNPHDPPHSGDSINLGWLYSLQVHLISLATPLVSSDKNDSSSSSSSKSISRNGSLRLRTLLVPESFWRSTKEETHVHFDDSYSSSLLE